jgi:hypothetical protein
MKRDGHDDAGRNRRAIRRRGRQAPAAHAGQGGGGKGRESLAHREVSHLPGLVDDRNQNDGRVASTVRRVGHFGRIEPSWRHDARWRGPRGSGGDVDKEHQCRERGHPFPHGRHKPSTGILISAVAEIGTSVPTAGPCL